MAIGRPLSTNTIVKRLRHLRDNAFYDTVEQHVLDAIANTLASNPNQPIKHLRTMITDLQSVLDTMPMHATDAEVKMLTSCIDGLARIEADRPVKAKELKAKVMATNAMPHEVMPHEVTVRSRSIAAIIGAIDVLLEEAGCGAGEDVTFQTLHHLIDVLERLS